MAASLLTAKDRRGHPRAQIAKLVRIARRAHCRADWLTTMLGEPGGDRNDPAYGHYTRTAAVTAGEAHRLDWERDRRQARTDRDVARAKASRACAEVAAIAAEHGIQP